MGGHGEPERVREGGKHSVYENQLPKVEGSDGWKRAVGESRITEYNLPRT